MEKQNFFNEVRAHYNLRSVKANKPTNIYFVVYIKGTQYKLNTGVRIYPKHWSNKEQRAKIIYSQNELDKSNNEIVNKKLSEYNDRWNEYKYYICSRKMEADLITLKSYMTTGKMETKKFELIKLLRQGVKEDYNISDSSKANYNRVIDKAESYLNAKKIIIKESTQINTEFIRSLQTYVRENYNISVATFNDFTKILSIIIKNYIVKKGYMNKSDFTNIIFDKQTNKIDTTDNKIALTDEEIITLYNYKCKTQSDEELKDIFLMECLTGHRISEIKDIDKNLYEDNGKLYFRLVQNKTKNNMKSRSFIFQMAVDILNKYNRKLPSFNKDILDKRIKVIAKEAGIKGSESILYQGANENEAKEITKERYDLISSHTGRRTFVTLLSVRGYDTEQIKMYTGHKDSEMVEKYNKLAKDGTLYSDKFKNNLKNHPDLILKYYDESDNNKLFGRDNEFNSNNYVKNIAAILKSLDEDRSNGINIMNFPNVSYLIKLIKSENDINIDVLKQYNDLIFQIAKSKIDIELYQKYQMRIGEKVLSYDIIDGIFQQIVSEDEDEHYNTFNQIK
jgi:integrase